MMPTYNFHMNTVVHFSEECDYYFLHHLSWAAVWASVYRQLSRICRKFRSRHLVFCYHTTGDSPRFHFLNGFCLDSVSVIYQGL